MFRDGGVVLSTHVVRINASTAWWAYYISSTSSSRKLVPKAIRLPPFSTTSLVLGLAAFVLDFYPYRRYRLVLLTPYVR